MTHPSQQPGVPPAKAPEILLPYYRRFKLPDDTAEFEKHMAVLAADYRMRQFEAVKYPKPSDPGILWVHVFWSIATLPA